MTCPKCEGDQRHCILKGCQEKTLVIGLTGVKGSGKTTTLKFIEQLYGEVIEIMLAKKLKKVCSDVFNIPFNYFNDQSLKEKKLDKSVELGYGNIEKCFKAFYPDKEYLINHYLPYLGMELDTPRKVAQYIGTEILRSVDPDVHCKTSEEVIENSKINIVSDIRFWNEYEYFKNNEDHKFIPLYVQNDKAESKVTEKSHISEKYILEIGKQCDKIDNNGTLLELKENIKTVLEKYFG